MYKGLAKRKIITCPLGAAVAQWKSDRLVITTHSGQRVRVPVGAAEKKKKKTWFSGVSFLC